MLVDRERHRTLEPGRRQHMTAMAGILEPLDDRTQALCHSRGRIADAVIVDQEKTHGPSVQTGNLPVNTPRWAKEHRTMSLAKQSDLRRRTEQLLEGPLKHIKAAALAAALLPLASVAATPASAQTECPSAGVCGIVFNDENNNGVQDVGETGIPDAIVVICQLCDGSDTLQDYTGPAGTFNFFPDLSVPTTVAVLIPTGTQASPSDVGDNTLRQRR